ncbi:SEC-C metal-binding domain-containing protein [uncultured Tissierella sp.]|uniref:YecA family protein n=1 Tax=uncultured Tissierella sp. TaxID=448160 RepID=UPI0028060503|nr:SEC-C metal-binding domain-containing protein [uncultured Tissierella sp.]MDU5082828.1 SEC-C metal-binding domain-containing protein [Bacillota bacterium]
MNLEQLKQKLEKENGSFDKDITDRLAELKKDAVSNNNQDSAKEIWCLEQIASIKNLYIKMYDNLLEKKHFDAWHNLERIEIKIVYLRRHFNYSGNKYNLEFIEEYSEKFQKLFPYFIFMSRESIIKKSECSICGKPISIRKPCGHKVGDIYNGEMCLRKVVDMEFLAMALVENPVDKYTVLFPEGKEYDYSILDNLMQYLKTPFDKWDLEIIKEIKPEYKGIGRNDKCPCKSGSKYKKCCLRSGGDLMDHHKILLYDQPEKEIIPNFITSTWKE